MDRDVKRALLTVAGVALAGYVAYRVIRRAATSVGEGLTNAGSALGSGLYDLFHKKQAGELLYYVVTFPDKQRHAIASGTVDTDGTFAWQGKRYRLLVDKRIVSGNNKFAFPV